MSRISRAVLIRLRRGIVSMRFLTCAVVCALFMIFFIYNDYAAEYQGFGLYYFLQGVDHSGADRLLLMITVFPVATMFCDDRESGMIKFLLPREGKNGYSLSLTLSAGVTSGMCMFLAYMIFSAFILIKYPLVPTLDAENIGYLLYSFPNGELLGNGHAPLCYFLYFLTKGALASFYGMLAALQSVIITDRRFSVISPIIMNAVISFAGSLLRSPAFLDPNAVFSGHTGLYTSFGGSLDNISFSPITALYPLIFCTVTAVLTALCISQLLKIKVEAKI